MPCNQRRTITANMDAANLDALSAAVRAAGGTSIMLSQDGALSWVMDGQACRWRAGALTVSRIEQAGAVKRAYTAELFKRAARSAGFTVRTTNTQMVAEKRVYATS